ncbi:hypothetical protein Q5752_005650 [Cryptotrichosporon argae]
MYWYLSFLRPPPVAVSPTAGSITITPQVANDLRTETRFEPTDIDYVWQCVYPAVRRPHKAQELTTFVPPASTYRPLDVPLPPVKAGERWRLGLVERRGSRTSRSSGAEDLLGLSEDAVGVVGVWSMGIDIRRERGAGEGVVRRVEGRAGRDKDAGGDAKGTGKGKGKSKDDTAKQTRIQREWALPFPVREGADEAAVAGPSELRIIEQTSFDLDKKVWDSGLALASWLHRHARGRGPHPNARAAAVLADLWGGRCVVELGSGTGLVSIALGPLVQAATIYATDLDSALELMRENIALNARLDGGTVGARELDWAAPLPPSFGGAWPDVVVAADVTYNTASFPALVSTLDGLLTPHKGKRPPRLLLAYKQRDAAERDLWGLLEAKGIRMELVDTVGGAGDEGPVEIWVGERG